MELITTKQGQQLAKETGVKFHEIKENNQIAFAEIVEDAVKEFLAKVKNMNIMN
ncbi:MAG: hypothetical protein ACFFDN_44235 [Candidatus Hodarchaeota archaeon]